MKFILGALLGGLWAAFIVYGTPLDISTAAGLTILAVPAFLLGVAVSSFWPRRH